MNFFKSILSDDPDRPIPQETYGYEPTSATNPPQMHDDGESDHVDQDHVSPSRSETNSNSGIESTEGGGVGAGGWSFGGLIKTFATRSESVIETYRRDLMEFGSGLRKETELFRETASRVVKDFPASIEVGASVAHGSLETVSHAIDGVMKSTAEIISHGKETLLPSSELEYNTPDTIRNLDVRRYCRFDAQLRAIQSDSNTYCEEPEDMEDYSKWKEGFALEEKNEEVESLIGENRALEDIYKRLVPNAVDRDTFWCRYFYRVYKLKQQESVRANLVKRVISIDDEEELSWDVDDDDDDKEEASYGSSKGNALENKEMCGKDLPQTEREEIFNAGLQRASSNGVDENGENKAKVANVDKANVVESGGDNLDDERVRCEQPSEVKSGESVVNPDEKLPSDGKKVDHSDSSKDSDLSAISMPQSVAEEEDLGWDEIEDLGSIDEKKVTQTASPNRADVRKRLSAAEEDEDLSWDIEDDDEPVKT